ncbi:MAG: CpsD/CapB family tyrosine-protein kinase, partial [Acidocella sp.]|nr:CpsD/CapB family tyrosine-protein kinase [Acidocella sp.]
SGFSEAFRIARNNLYHAIPGARAKIIMLSSASVGDGKSTVAANLARALADDGKRVVLVDADLRMGQLHHTLRLNQSPGLSDWLIDGEAVAMQTPDGQRFAVLPSGVKPPNPAELMNDPALKEVLKTLRASYDFIIFDTAPVPAVSDPLILARQADLILSVVHLGHTKHRDVAAHDAIMATLAKRHGIIINGTQAENSGYYDYVYGEEPARSGAFQRLRTIFSTTMTKGRAA